MKKIDEKLAAEISLKKPAVSNSRLGVHSVHPQNPKLSFDAMTIVGNLSRDNAQKLSSFMSIEPQIRLWDILLTASKKLKRSLAPTGNLYR